MKRAFSLAVVVVASIGALAVGCAAPVLIPTATPGTCDKDTTTIGGDVEGTACGNITVKAGGFHVAEGKTFEITKGSVVVMPNGTDAINVDGTLTLSGVKDAPVFITSSGGWGGITVGGTVNATGAHITGKDASIFQARGSMTLTDVTIDFEHALLSPDCVTVVGGTLAFDHVHISNCHCPMHVQAADSMTVTNSVLDGAAYPIMLAETTAQIHHNNLLAAAAPMQDVGGHITADVSGNYWGADHVNIDTESGITADLTQFSGTDNFSTSAFGDAGAHF